MLDLMIRRTGAFVAVLLLASWLGGCSGSSLSDFSFGKANIEPPVEPIPSPPPSDFCNSTTPIMAVTTMR